MDAHENNGTPGATAPKTIECVATVSPDQIPRITIIDFNENYCREYTVSSVDTCVPPPEGINTRWINVDSISNIEIINKIGTAFGISPLIIEDICSKEQQPKTEIHIGYALVVIRMFRCQNKGHILSEQVSIVFGPRFVLTFQEVEGDVFQSIRKRIYDERGRIRTSRADYLAYSLIDTIVDHYFAVLDMMADIIENIQEQLITDPSTKVLRDIYEIKRKMLEFRRYVLPVREAIRQLEREPDNLFRKTTRPYLRDLYDHIVHITDHIENYREWLASMLDIYLSSVTNRLNEVIKVLTIVSTVAVPPTMIASWYGMNFRYMPELESIHAYPLVFLLSVGVSIVMLLMFWRKGWL